MSVELEVKAATEKELVIARLLDVPPEKAFRAWTDPELIKQWFSPAPWVTVHAETDVRPGGKRFIVMRNPEGNDFRSEGVYLGVIPNRKLVFTDAYSESWGLSTKPFYTSILTFENQNGLTKYTARALHWTIEDKLLHAKIGYHEAWSQCADQLEAIAKAL